MKFGPDKDDTNGTWNDFTCYSNSKSGDSPFQYNPNEQTPSNSAFPETDDVEAPEKM